MANITPRAVGEWASTTTQTQTVTLPTHQAGDMLIVRAVVKPYTFAPTITTSGWNAVGSAYANGTTTNGNGVGSLVSRAWYKEAASSSETNPVIDWHTDTSTANPGAAVAVAYQKNATADVWATPTGAGGGDSTARTSQTATISSHISVVAGDLVDFFTYICDNYDLTVPVITQTGVTYSSTTEYPATALSTGDGFDIAADGGYRTASSGTSSAAAVVTWTAGNSEQGGAWQTRLRLSTQGLDASLINSTGTAFLPTLSWTQFATPSLVNSAASPFAATAYRGYPAKILSLNPISFWRLGETSGTNADDLGSAAADGTYTGGYTLNQTGALTGDTDKAVAFNGSTGYVDATDVAAHSLQTTGKISVVAWAKADGVETAYGWVVNHSCAAEVEHDWGIKQTNDYWRFYLYDYTGGERAFANSATGTCVAGTWYCLVLTADDTTDTLIGYIDGEEAGRDETWQNTSSVLNGTVDIGRRASQVTSSDYFAGVVDEVAVFDYILTPAQIADLYAAGSGGAQNLSASLVNSTGTAFSGHAVTPGPVGLTAALIDSTASATSGHAATSNYPLTAALVDSTATATSGHAVTPGPVALTAALVDSTGSAFAASVARDLAASLVDSTATATAGHAVSATYAISVEPVSSLASPFTATASPGPVAVTADLVVSTASAISGHAVIPGAVTLTADLVDSTGSPFAAIVGPPGLIPALLDSTATPFTATASPGAVGLTADLVDSTAVLFASSIETGPIGVGADLVDSTAVVFTTTLTFQQFATPDLVDQTAVVYATSVASTYALSPSQIAQDASAFAATVEIGVWVFAPALIDQSAALFDATVQSQQVVGAALIDSTGLPFTAQAGVQQYLTPALTDQTVIVYTADIATGPIGVTAALVDSTGTAYAPTLTWQQFLTPQTVAQAALAYPAGTVVGAVDLAAAILDSTASPYAASASATYGLAPALIDGAAVAYGASLAVGPVDLSASLIDRTAVAIGAEIFQGGFLDAGLIVRTAALFVPLIEIVRKDPFMVPSGSARVPPGATMQSDRDRLVQR